MAFPQVASVTETNFPITTDDTHLCDMPATVNAGDLLLMFFACESTPANSNITTPSGWTLIDTYFEFSTLHLLAKVADGTEGGTQVDVDTQGTLYAVAHVYRITGFAGSISTDIDATTTHATGRDPASLTAGWGSDDNLWIAWFVWNQTANRTPTSPTNFGTAVHTSLGTTSSMPQLATATDENATASYNPGTWTLSSTAGTSDPFVALVVIKPSTATTVSSVGAIATAEAVPSPVLKSGISLSGIASEEAFGTATMRMNVTAEAIASEEAFGEPTVSPIQAVSPSSIISEEAVGTPAVTPDTYTITPDGIESAEAIGEAVIGRAVFPSSIDSLEAFGTAHIKKYVTFDGIASAEAVGSHQLNRSFILTGIASTEAFGTTVIQVGSVTITVSGISSEEDVPTELFVVAATTSGFRRPPPGSARYIPTPSAGSARYAVRPPAGV